MALKVRETDLADSFSIYLKECNERKRPILIEKTLLSHHSFKSVPGSHTFGGLTLPFRETVFYRFSATVRFESEMFGFIGNVIIIHEQTDNLLVNYNGKLVKWNQGVLRPHSH